MKNITVSVDEETHQFARIRAAELGTSVSALVRGYLLRLSRDDSPHDDPDANGAARRRVRQLHEGALARAEAMAGRPIGDVQELAEFRRSLLAEVASDFEAKGIGIQMPGAVNREEIYDRSRARLEAQLAASEDRSEELAVLKARVEDGDRPASQVGQGTD